MSTLQVKGLYKVSQNFVEKGDDISSNTIKNYILKRYPLLCDINLDSIDDIKEYSKGFGINHFYFNRIDTDIPDLKYISNKTKVK